MSDLPQGWEWKTVGEITECLDSKRVPITKNLREEGEIPYYGANGIQGYVKNFIFDEELLLLAEDGGSWGKNQKCVNIIRGKSWVNNHAHVLRMKSNVLIKFLEVYLNMADLTKYINGTTRGKLNQKQMNNIEVPLPSIKIQKEIVSILEHAESLKQRREGANEDTNAIIQSIFNEMFGEINSYDKSWERKKLGDVCSFVRGPFGGSLKKEIFQSQGFAVYEQQHAIGDSFTDIRYFISEEKFNEMKRFELRPGDLIMSCSGTMGKIAIVPNGIRKGIINQALLKLTTHKNLSRLFLKHWLESQGFQNSLKVFSQGAAIQNVASVKILKDIKIPLPPIDVQNQFAEIVEKIESIKLKQSDSTSDINNLFDALMQKAFNGELVE